MENIIPSHKCKLLRNFYNSEALANNPTYNCRRAECLIREKCTYENVIYETTNLPQKIYRLEKNIHRYIRCKLEAASIKPEALFQISISKNQKNVIQSLSGTVGKGTNPAFRKEIQVKS